MNVKIKKSANRVTIASGDFEIFFEVEGLEELRVSEYSFAVWAVLPIAMRSGTNLRIEGPVDPKTISNADLLSRAWELWLPARYSATRVSADSSEAAGLSRHPSVTLFSGGIDSTFNLLCNGPQTVRSHVLTVHGLDYPLDNSSQFSDFLKKTDPILTDLNYQRIVIRTNIYEPVKNLAINHGFCLASCAFLLRDHFEHAVIAPDYTWEQDMVVHPWGTNHVTNQYFSGSDFKLVTASSAASRTEKVARIASHATALSSVTFCSSKKNRPHNCGICSKCIRTKCMLLANSIPLPDIFLNRELLDRNLQVIDLNDPKEYAFFADLYIKAKDNGTLDRIPGLRRLFQKWKAGEKRRAQFDRFMKKVKKLLP